MIARHPCGTGNGPVPLLPSGPGGVRDVPLRRTRLSAAGISPRHIAGSIVAACILPHTHVAGSAVATASLSHKYVRASLEPALNYHNRRVATDLARTFSTRRQWRRGTAVAIKDLRDGRAANSYRPYPDDVRAGAGAEPGEGGRPRRGCGRPRCADRLPPGALSFALPVPDRGDGAVRIGRADSRTDEREAGAARRGTENRDRRADLRAPCGRRLP